MSTQNNSHSDIDDNDDDIDDIDNIDNAPQLSRSSILSPDATPKCKESCNQCAINTLQLTKLNKQLLITKQSLNEYQNKYQLKCDELDETVTYYMNIYDAKCKELSDLQESLNAIFYKFYQIFYDLFYLRLM